MCSPRRSWIRTGTSAMAHPTLASTAWSISRAPATDPTRYACTVHSPILLIRRIAQLLLRCVRMFCAPENLRSACVCPTITITNRCPAGLHNGRPEIPGQAVQGEEAKGPATEEQLTGSHSTQRLYS